MHALIAIAISAVILTALFQIPSLGLTTPTSAFLVGVGVLAMILLMAESLYYHWVKRSTS